MLTSGNIMKQVDYKSIPESRKTFGLRLLKRIDPYALYVTDCYSFEIHKIRIQENVKGFLTNEFYKVMEKMASSKEFGQYAWCYERLSTVLRHFGMFGDHIDEIISKLDDLGFEQLTQSKAGVNGYLF